MGRIALWIGAGILAILLAALGTGYFLISSLDVKGELTKALESQTGRKVDIAGPIHTSFFPTLGFHAQDIQLANAAGGTAAHLLTVKEAQVGVDAQALLQERRINVQRLVLVEPHLALEVDAKGAPNWLLAPQTPQTPSPAPAPSAPEFKGFSADDVRIEKGRVTYVNAATKVAYNLTDLNLATAAESLTTPILIKGTAVYEAQPVDLELTLAQLDSLMKGQRTPLGFTLKSAPMAMSFSGAFDPPTAGLAGAFAAQGPSLRTLSAWLGAPLGEGATLQAFRVAGLLTLASEGAIVQDAALQLDAIKAIGDLAFSTKDERARITGALQLADLDLNPFLAPAGAPTASIQAVNAQAQGWDATPMDLAGLKAFDTDLKLKTGTLLFQNIKLDKADLRTQLQDGVMLARLREFSAYGGTGQAQLKLDLRGAQPKVEQIFSVRDLRAGVFLPDAVGFSALDGAATFTANLKGEGATQDAIMKSLSGDMALVLENGALKGVDLGGVSRTISKALSGEMFGPNARTPFTAFEATFRLAGGKAVTRDFKMAAADAEITAEGILDIGGKAMDLRITPKAESLLSRLGGPFKGAGVAVPFRASGGWDKPKFAPDLQGVGRNLIASEMAKLEARLPRAVARTQGVGDDMIGVPAPITPAQVPADPLEALEALRKATTAPAPVLAPTPG
jgi:AsmA protein